MIHLAFAGASYALCGATTVSTENTTRASEATCPDCVDDFTTMERVHQTLHASGQKPAYE